MAEFTQADPSSVPEDLKSRLKKAYDVIAPTYNNLFVQDDDPIRLDYVTRVLSIFKDSGIEDAHALELGCGAGIPSTKILLESESPRIRVTANDLSTTQIELARENLASFSNRVTLVSGDMLELSFATASFDAVMGFYSIIHLPREEQTVLMKKIAGWLKPGGIFLGNFSVEEIETAIDETWLNEKEGWMFWSGWGSDKTAKLVEETGLEILVKETRQDAHVPDAPFLWVIAKKT
ncbi:methyltransferase domain-containing protein [Dendryphion nanum]|uniref:Methyltransferase domain-containing protein n=1 Tax=Dendryphion nanum TaxID=256645 RepID=A0A9P9ED96_9PLEO|nr:methyltransferase domain-containing protein [Dendryphion nanum]